MKDVLGWELSEEVINDMISSVRQTAMIGREFGSKFCAVKPEGETLQETYANSMKHPLNLSGKFCIGESCSVYIVDCEGFDPDRIAAGSYHTHPNYDDADASIGDIVWLMNQDILESPSVRNIMCVVASKPKPSSNNKAKFNVKCYGLGMFRAHTFDLFPGHLRTIYGDLFRLANHLSAHYGSGAYAENFQELHDELSIAGFEIEDPVFSYDDYAQMEKNRFHLESIRNDVDMFLHMIEGYTEDPVDISPAKKADFSLFDYEVGSESLRSVLENRFHYDELVSDMNVTIDAMQEVVEEACKTALENTCDLARKKVLDAEMSMRMVLNNTRKWWESRGGGEAV